MEKDGFTLVDRKVVKGNGKRVDSSLYPVRPKGQRSANMKAYVSLYGDVSEITVKSELKRLCPSANLTVWKLECKNPTFSSFKISADQRSLAYVFDDSIWPLGSIIREWRKETS